MRPAIAMTYTSGQGACFEQRFYNSTPYNVCFVRAVFRIGKDSDLKLLNPQPPINAMDILEFKDREYASIREPSDFVPYKSCTDVTIVGAAQSPNNLPSTGWEIGIQVDAKKRLVKKLRLHGARDWVHRSLSGWRLSDPEPTSRIPLLHELAYGGIRAESSKKKKEIHALNPLGVGFSDDPKSAQTHEKFVACQIEYQENPLNAFGKPVRAANVGPLPPYFEDRLKFAGTPENQPFNSMPTDMDLLFWNAAPLDQRVEGFLQGGESVSLSGLFAEGTVKFNIPSWTCTAISTDDEGNKASHPMNLDTVHIDIDRRHVSVRWCVLVPYQLEDRAVEFIELLGAPNPKRIVA
jgi:hypothetical protein